MIIAEDEAEMRRIASTAREAIQSIEPGIEPDVDGPHEQLPSTDQLEPIDSVAARRNLADAIEGMFVAARRGPDLAD